MGRRGDCAGASSLFLQLCFGCQVIPIVFHCWTDLGNLFSWPTRSPFLHGKHVISILCFHYFFSVTMPGGCRSQLSWIPSLLLGSTHYPIRHHCPSSSTVDEFTCNLQVKTQLFSEVVQPNAPFRNKQFHHSLS